MLDNGSIHPMTRTAIMKLGLVNFLLSVKRYFNKHADTTQGAFKGYTDGIVPGMTDFARDHLVPYLRVGETHVCKVERREVDTPENEHGWMCSELHKLKPLYFSDIYTVLDD